MNHSKIIKTFSQLEAVLDQHLFQKEGEDGMREKKGWTRAAQAGAGGAVVIGTGALGRHVLRAHYGAADQGYRTAAGDAARDAGGRTASAARTAGERTAGAAREVGRRAASAGGAVKKAYSQGSRSAGREGAGMAGKIAGGVRKVATGKTGKAVRKAIKFSSPLSRRLVELSERMGNAGYR
jgi:hypothetical protein